jgi:ribonuclease III
MNKIKNNNMQHQAQDKKSMNDIKTIPLIYNKNNKLITKKQVERIINKFLTKQITINEENLNLYITALTHKSYTKSAYIVDEDANIDPESGSILSKGKKYVINVPWNKIKKKQGILELRKKSYDILEFLGDKTISYIITKYIYDRYGETENEGFLTKWRTNIEKGETLYSLSKIVGLKPYIIIAEQIEITRGRDNKNILEDVLEAFMGAMDIDVGIDICYEFFVNLIEKHIDISSLLSVDTNYKEQLLRYYKKRDWSPPQYIVEINSPSSDNKRVFKVHINDNYGKKIGKSASTSKKRAEQQAACNALVKFGVIEDPKSDTSSITI